MRSLWVGLLLLLVYVMPIPSWASRDPIASVSVPFTIDRAGNHYQDVLVLTQAQYDALSDAQLEARKEARYAAWRAFVAAEALKPPPTRAQLTARRVALLAQITDLQAEAEALRLQIQSMP